MIDLKKLKVEVMRTQRLISLLREEIKPLEIPRIHNQIIAKVKQKFSLKKPENPLLKEKIRFAFRLNGGIGDIINASAFLNKLYQTFDLPTVDIYNHKPEFVKILLKDLPYINQILETPENIDDVKNHYHLYLSLSDFISYQLILPKKVPVNIQLFVDALKNNRQEKYEPYIKYHGALEGLFAKEMVAIGKNRLSAPGIFLGIAIEESDILISYIPKPNKLNLKNYITIHDGCDVTSPIVQQKSTKQWPQKHWDKLIKKIKKAFPDLMIVQIGAKFSLPIKTVDYCLVNKTSITEAFDLIAGANFHIDIESGLVRFAKAVNVSSIVIFGSTNPDYYQLKNNISVIPKICGDCGWAVHDWMVKCPLGYKIPPCTKSITADEVFIKVLQTQINRNTNAG